MLIKLSLVLSIVSFILCILNPAFYLPWSGFISEYLVFWSVLFLLPLFFKKTISAPKASLFFLLISFIPILQYSFGQIIYFDKALLSFIYLISFWFAIIIGFNSAKRYESSLDYFFLTIIGCGVVSSLIAIAQWLSIDMSADWVMSASSRPSANMAQPNHLATFLLISLISCFYFYEHKKFKHITLLIPVLLFLSVIALTQSRTAWLSLIFIYLYWIIAYRRHILTISIKKMSMLLGCFIASAILLPIFKEKVLKLEAATMAERASSGYERIQIWLQAIEAIKIQPLWGYGWNQGSFAQYETIGQHYFSHYLSSFHNIFLDIIIWCGIPLGILLIVICIWIVLKILIKSFSSTQIVLISAICVILIHGLLEYPLSYSYFLLPLGFMLGYLFFTFDKKYIKVSKNYLVLAFICGAVLNVYVFKEYSYIPDNIVAAETHEMNERKDEVELPYKFYLFETFEQRSKWISLYPCTTLSQQQIDEIQYMVKTYIIPYDLYKFSQILYFNGYEEDAQKNLNILSYMYKKEFQLNDLKCIKD